SFAIVGYTRFVVLSWVIDEIRFQASRIEAGDFPWWLSGEDPARVAACQAEPDEHEMAILDTLADAVAFTLSYLEGKALRESDVVRIKPTPARYEGRQQ